MPAQNIKTMTYTLLAEGKPITQLSTICIEGKQYASLSMLEEASKGDFEIFPLCEEGFIFVQDELAASQQYLLVIKESPVAIPYDQ